MKLHWQPLFDHMADAHGLTLTETEMSDIAAAVDQVRERAETLAVLCPACQDQEPDRNRCPECLGSGLL